MDGRGGLSLLLTGFIHEVFHLGSLRFLHQKHQEEGSDGESGENEHEVRERAGQGSHGATHSGEGVGNPEHSASDLSRVALLCEEKHQSEGGGSSHSGDDNQDVGEYFGERDEIVDKSSDSKGSRANEHRLLSSELVSHKSEHCAADDVRAANQDSVCIFVASEMVQSKRNSVELDIHDEEENEEHSQTKTHAVALLAERDKGMLAAHCRLH